VTLRALLAVGIAAVLATGCASTKERAEKKLAADAAAAAVAAKATTLTIKANDAIKSDVLAVIASPDGSTAAVVVELKLDDKSKSVVWAPIDVKLYDAGGNVVAEGNVEGADPAIVHVPSLAGGTSVLYVNDLLSPSAAPTRATVEIGGNLLTLPAQPGALKTTVTWAVDPNYGPSFTGTVTNTTGIAQNGVIVQAVARKDGKVVAAGTSVVGALAPGESQDFQGLFVGDPSGAVVTATAPVSNVPGHGAPVPSQ
jgi:hypothetical protein